MNGESVGSKQNGQQWPFFKMLWAHLSLAHLTWRSKHFVSPLSHTQCKQSVSFHVVLCARFCSFRSIQDQKLADLLTEKSDDSVLVMDGSWSIFGSLLTQTGQHSSVDLSNIGFEHATGGQLFTSHKTNPFLHVHLVHLSNCHESFSK